MPTEQPDRRTTQHAPLFVLASLLLAALLVSGCATSAANLQSMAPAAQAPAPAGLEEVVAPISAYTVVTSPLATPTPTPDPEGKEYITVISEIRANVRSGPGTTFAIVAKVNPGGSLELLAQSENKLWYQVVPPTGVTTEEAWISADLVRLGGSADAVPVIAAATGDALLPADLSANWDVAWSCNSDRCEIKQCNAAVAAQVTRAVVDGYLPVEHMVTWSDDCFNTDAWTFEVNQVTGQERSGEASDNFLYGYWLGAEPGEANGVFPLDDERGVLVHCAGPQEVEIEEGGGWTTVYEGNTCHDAKTGMLVYMNYTKRWLFTGEFEGKTYERSYFGDSEKLEQRLVETNADLEFAEKK